MNSRRVVFLATTLTIAFLTSTAGVATASTDDDGYTSGAAVATVAPGDPSAAPLAQCEDPVVEENARTAADMINYKRSLHDADPLVYDGALSVIAQDWANHLAETGTGAINPDVQTMIPGQPVEGSNVYQWWIRGPEASTQYDLVLQVYNQPNFFNDESTHMGVGWVHGTDGFDYLYFFYVQYEFGDIGPDAAFYDEVDWLSDSGITHGFADGTFRPRESVTREAMAAFLYRFANPGTPDPVCEGPTRTFTDVTAGNPFCGAIEWLAAEGIANGWPDGTFRPSEPVSREATAAFLYRELLGDAAPIVPATCGTFGDVTSGSPFCTEIEWMAASGISTGWSDGTFRPGLSVERQAMAAFLFRSTV